MHRPTRRLLPLSLLLSLATAAHVAGAAPPPRQPPSPGCLDARRISEVRQPAADLLAIASAPDQFHRVRLASACHGVEASSDATLLAPQGWACTGAPAFVRHGTQLCRIAAVEPLAAREFAALSRQADRSDVATLEPVQVTGEAKAVRHGFSGSPNYCFSPRQMRSWSSDPKGLVVHVAPRFNAGRHVYRVELAGTCPVLASSPALQFVSGLGIGVICGNPGDVLLAHLDRPSLASHGARAVSSGARCAVSAVYPQ